MRNHPTDASSSLLRIWLARLTVRYGIPRSRAAARPWRVAKMSRGIRVAAPAQKAFISISVRLPVAFIRIVNIFLAVSSSSRVVLASAAS
eukprot:5859820-Prymnesium_polylepis.1